MRPLGPIRAILVASVLVLVVSAAHAQSYDPQLFGEMRWRAIGPYRGGRTHACTGVPSQPNVFYIGAVNGGVWKTTDYGRTWLPIFDDQPTGSIGAIAVAPSDPNIVYVGSGEGLQRPDLSTGDGIYKSTDAGKTWVHLGLRDAQQISEILVDPKNPNRLFVAALGHPYGPNAERGIFRSTDGGRTFEKVLGKDENTGGSDLAFDPRDASIVYATLWEARQAPWENGDWNGPGSGLFKSTDGGTTWRQLTKGLPTFAEGLGRMGIGVAPSDPNRIYAIVEARGGGFIYVSDDAGESWTKTAADARVAARPTDASEIVVDPKNPDIVYSVTIVTWKSTDGGKTWTGYRGAPGGDDYQRMWIHPDHPDIQLLASDQGAIITVNGGASWSSWYNQPTAQMYHVTADNAFPYRVCGGQQESGSACVASRGNDGAVTFRDWHPAAFEEYGYAAPDPLDPEIVYGGKLTRYDRRTGQEQNVAPKPIRMADYRVLRTAPVVFSPVDPHVLYFASNTLWKTRDAGQSWQQISPDLTRKTWEVPATVGKYRDTPSAKPTLRGVIYAVAPSPLDINRIWAGTDDGLVQVTTDGGLHWVNVTPPQLIPWAKVSILDAGHFDAQTAYAAINTLRLDDLRPHILRTHDGGKTWKEITSGIPDGAIVNVVREDPKRKGLLFAGSEREVYVSLDDGDHWQSLRLNMPATSIRDVIIKNDDLVAGTHGRGFWILDDITPLRQLTAAVAGAPAFLFRPQAAYRVRWNMNTDTPLPPDEPFGQNAPDGAIIDYVLNAAPAGPVTLEIRDAAGRLVRKYSSADPVEPLDTTQNIPTYWIRPQQVLSAVPGMHRFLGDMHHPPAPRVRPTYPIAAIPHDTPRAFTSPWVMPGQYRVTLTVDGKSYTQPLTLKMDPRVKTPPAGLQQQFTLSKQLYDGLVESAAELDGLSALRKQLRQLQQRAAAGPVAEAIAALENKAGALEGAAGPGGPGGGGQARAAGALETVNGLRATLLSLMGILQSADVTPTTQAAGAVAERRKALAGVLARWAEIESKDLPALNALLKQANLPEVKLGAPASKD